MSIPNPPQANETANRLGRVRNLSILRQALLYLTTAVAITYSGYNHLDFVARGIRHVTLSDLQTAWPIFFLVVALPLLIFSAMWTLVEPVRGARLALIGVALASGYYLISIPSLFCLISIFVFIAPQAILANTLPCLLLLATAAYSIKVARTMR